ncbi:hypothetical protein P3T22_004701 [Paraburkholderia sp. GAS348]
MAVVFFRGLDCFNCEIVKKATSAQPDAIRALGFRWFHSNVNEHREPGRRFMPHGVPTRFLFYRGKRLGRATGWQGLGQFEAAVAAAAAREKIRAVNAVNAVGSAANGKKSGKSSAD